MGNEGLIISIDTFGESARGNDLFHHFGFTTEKVMAKINNYIKV
ncbi:MAG: hypothetical protein ACK5Z5_07915 [Neisseriaceae bacterium]